MTRALTATAIVLVVATTLLCSAQTGTLRPIGDGSLEGFYNNSQVACSSTTCYTVVDETSGANCSGTIVAGGTDYVYTYGLSVGAKQTFTLDVSSIPNGSVIQRIELHTCARYSTTYASSGAARAITVVNGAETDCAAIFTFTSSWAEYICTITLATPVTKGSTTTVEIGAQLTSGADDTFNTFAAIVYYGSHQHGQTIIGRLNPVAGSVETVARVN